jgi:hypothetical protein
LDRFIIARNRLARSFGKGKPFPIEWISEAESSLQETVGAILQINDPDYKTRITEVVVAKGIGGATMTGLAGLIGTFGAASTGTAISTLSGAAATSAKLYWLGSLVGAGAATGGGILIGVAILTGWGGIKLWKGNTKQIANLEEYEGRLLLALDPVLVAIQNSREEQITLSDLELEALENWSHIFLQSLTKYQNDPTYKKLAFKHKLRLRRAIKRLNRFHRRLHKWIK